MNNQPIWRGWKTIAVISLVLFLTESLFIIWAYSSTISDEKQKVECFYDICSEYEDADYDFNTNVCYCYEPDVLGNLKVAKTKIIK